MKKVIIGRILVLITFCFFGCGSSSDGGSETGAHIIVGRFRSPIERPHVLQVSHPFSGASSVHQLLSSAFGPAIERRSAGQIRVEILDGQFISDVALIERAVSIGTVEVGITATETGQYRLIVDRRFIDSLPTRQQVIVTSEIGFVQAELTENSMIEWSP